MTAAWRVLLINSSAQRAEQRARQRVLASRDPMGTWREPGIRCGHRDLLRVQRGQGRAVGAAEDHMVCLELFLKIEIIPGKAKTSLGTMLSH